MALSKRVRFEVFKRDGFTCQYCGRRPPEAVLHVDHVKPRCEGGSDELINLVTSCMECNLGKGPRELSDDSLARLQQSEVMSAKERAEIAIERRDQLEQYLEWKSAEDDLTSFQIDSICDRWAKLSNSTINDLGRVQVAELLEKHGFNEVYEAVAQVCKRHLKPSSDPEKVYTFESQTKAFRKIQSTIEWSRKFKDRPWMGQIHYIKGILRNRFNLSWDAQSDLVKRMEAAHVQYGVDLQTMQECAAFSKTIEEFEDFVS